MTRGDIHNQFLEIIVATICLLLVAGLAYGAYNNYSNNDSASAEKVLGIIASGIEQIDDGKEVNLTLQGFEGSDQWYIAAWNVDDENRPERCSLDNCVCLCKKSKENYVESCQNRGYCKSYADKRFSVSSSYAGISVDYGYKFKDPVFDCVFLAENLQELSLGRVGKEYSLSSRGREESADWSAFGCKILSYSSRTDRPMTSLG